ncbi:hypothetical protein GCM10009763_14140 [Dermacoccus profundi]|uniref:Uncharacterized protein n=1 Tax=Dermacoccus profundi TaxID=322602 RepID=A0ABN2D2I9_9MICO
MVEFQRVDAEHAGGPRHDRKELGLRCGGRTPSEVTPDEPPRERTDEGIVQARGQQQMPPGEAARLAGDGTPRSAQHLVPSTFDEVVGGPHVVVAQHLGSLGDDVGLVRGVLAQHDPMARQNLSAPPLGSELVHRAPEDVEVAVTEAVDEPRDGVLDRDGGDAGRHDRVDD